MTASSKPELTPAVADRVVYRMLQDAATEADPLYWDRRAEQYDAVPMPDEAQACRNRAAVLRMNPNDSDWSRLIQETFDAVPAVDDELSHVDDGGRRLQLVPSAGIVPRRTRWLWGDRLPLGTIALLAGPGGAGKSTIAYWLAAKITRGQLPGELYGQARAVIICSTEDAWEEVIVPRLLAADADLTLVYRVDVTGGDLSLPRDLDGLRLLAERVRAALLIVDPLISRLGKLDTHKDAETRQALEPLLKLTAASGLCVLGLIHFSKSAQGDVVSQIMGSRAFVNVARSVHVVMPDPDDETRSRRLFGTPKNNMGRTDLPTLAFTISSAIVGQDPDDGSDVTASEVSWLDGDSTISIEDAFQLGREAQGGTRISECIDTIRSLLEADGGCVERAAAKRQLNKAGYNDRMIARAVAQMKLLVETIEGSYPRRTTWTDPRSVPSGDKR